LFTLFPQFIVQAQIKDWENCVVDGVPTLKCFEVVYGNILFMASALIVMVLFIMIIIGGLNYLTSFGNPEKVKKAQATLKYAVIGVILFVSSYLILNIIQILFLGGDSGTVNLFKLNLP
jgi:hypothetical protein